MVGDGGAVLVVVACVVVGCVDGVVVAAVVGAGSDVEVSALEDVVVSSSGGVEDWRVPNASPWHPATRSPITRATIRTRTARLSSAAGSLRICPSRRPVAV
jgi:hypothetical protein